MATTKKSSSKRTTKTKKQVRNNTNNSNLNLSHIAKVNKNGGLSIHLHYVQILLFVNLGMFISSFIVKGSTAKIVLAGFAVLYVYLNYRHHRNNNNLETQTILEYSLIAFICWFIYSSIN